MAFAEFTQKVLPPRLSVTYSGFAYCTTYTLRPKSNNGLRISYSVLPTLTLKLVTEY
jgi:hypothetical protein